MNDPALWRTLAAQFLALRLDWRARPGGANDWKYTAFEALAEQAASEMAIADAPDSLGWLKALKKEGFPFQHSGQSKSNGVLSEAEYAQRIIVDTIDGMCQASAAFCEAKAERAELAQALRAEFEERLAQKEQAHDSEPPVELASTPHEVLARQEDEPTQETLREAVIRKVQNPQTYTVLSIPEAALYLEVRPRTVYRWTADGKLKKGGRRGSITIESIRRLEKKRSRKRPEV